MIEGMRLERNPLKQGLLILGPGLITGASDDDPSGVGTYVQAGASYGYATVWAAAIISVAALALIATTVLG